VVAELVQKRLCIKKLPTTSATESFVSGGEPFADGVINLVFRYFELEPVRPGDQVGYNPLGVMEDPDGQSIPRRRA
jgi:hypothetical protein